MSNWEEVSQEEKLDKISKLESIFFGFFLAIVSIGIVLSITIVYDWIFSEEHLFGIRAYAVIILGFFVLMIVCGSLMIRLKANLSNYDQELSQEELERQPVYNEDEILKRLQK